MIICTLPYPLPSVHYLVLHFIPKALNLRKKEHITSTNHTRTIIEKLKEVSDLSINIFLNKIIKDNFNDFKSNDKTLCSTSDPE